MCFGSFFQELKATDKSLTALTNNLGVVCGSHLYFEMLEKSANGSNCPPKTHYPTTDEFYRGLEGYAIALWVCVGVSVLILLFQYLYLAFHCYKYTPSPRREPTLWLNSMFIVPALFSFIGIIKPESADFVWLVFKVYLSLVTVKFMELTLEWYGGEQGLLEAIGPTSHVSFRVRPCLCMVCLPNKTELTTNKIKFLKYCIKQGPYIHFTAIFLVMIFLSSKELTIGNLDPSQGYVYLLTIILISFLLAVWALFVFIDMTLRNETLEQHKFKAKAVIFKLILFLVNVEGLVVDSLAAYGVIKCVAPLISTGAMGSVVKAILFSAQSLIMGSIVMKLYTSDMEHL